MNKKAFSLIEISVAILLVSILILGIGKGIVLLEKSKILTARDLTKDSPVALMDNLVLWLETTSEGSLINSNNSTNIKDNETIQTWNDLNPKSITKNNATQTTAASRPTYVKNVINGLPVLRFDGTDDHFLTPFLLNPVSSNFTIFVVIDTNPGIATGRVLLSQQDGSGTGRTILAHTSGAITSFLGGVTSTGPNLTYNPQIYRLKNKAGTIFFSSNGSTETSNVRTLESATGSWVIAAQKIIVNFFPVDIAEIIIFDSSLESDDIILIERYLAKKWGINCCK